MKKRLMLILPFLLSPLQANAGNEIGIPAKEDILNIYFGESKRKRGTINGRYDFQSNWDGKAGNFCSNEKIN